MTKKKTTTQKKSGAKKAAKAKAPTAVPAGAGDWREEMLEKVRGVIMGAEAGVIEEVKWRKPSNGMKGVAVWSHPACGIICTGEKYKKMVKLTFAKGASLEDAAGLFNASLEGGTRRAIDIGEGETVDAKGLKALVQEAVSAGGGKKAKTAKKKDAPRLLSGGNPQIAKGYGDGPVQAYIAAIPDWKREVARRIDALIERGVPKVRKAVKWNSPLYGMREGEWFMSMHCFDKYIKVAFFNGAELVPLPPVSSKQKKVRYLHVHEDGAMDEGQFVKWVRQASNLEGEKM